MAQVNQRLWKVPGQRTKRKAWGFTAQINGTQVRRYKTEWTQDDAAAEMAKALLKIEPEKPKGADITLAQAADRYLASKARKRTIEADRRQLQLLKAEFGEEAPLVEITASRISAYKAKRLAAVRKIGEGEAAAERRLLQLPSTARWRYSVTYSGWLTRSGSPSTTYPASGWRRSRRAAYGG